MDSSTGAVTPALGRPPAATGAPLPLAEPAASPTPEPRERQATGSHSLWRNRDYVAWLTADTAWQFGASIRAFAMLLITYAVTGSYIQAGTVSTVSTVAGLVATLPGGVLVDRWDRRRSLTVSGLLRAVVFGVAAVSWWTGTMTLGVLYAVGVASGLIGGLFSSASDAALKSVVPATDLPRAVAANQGRDAAVSLAASPISGALIAVSYALPFLAASVGAVLQVIGTHFIRADLRPPRATVTAAEETAHGGVRTWAHEMAQGFQVFRDIPVVGRMLPALVLVNGGINGLVAGITLILQGQGVEPWRIGLLDTAIGIGMLLGALAASPLISRIPTGRLVTVLFVSITVVLLPLGVRPTLGVALVCLSATGVAIPSVNGAMAGYFQARIPDELQGRALSSLGVINMSLMALMPAIVGVGLQTLGAGPTMLATAALLPLAAVALLTHRSFRALPTPDRWEGLPSPSPIDEGDPATVEP